MTDAHDTTARALLAQGQPEAFARLYELHAARMLAVARVLTGTLTDAEDAVQQTFLNLHLNRRALARADRPSAYAFGVLRNAAHRIRERRRPTALVADVAEPTEEDGPDTTGLARALDGLPPEQREVVTLKVDAGLTFEEIGSTLDISPNTAASRYRYALERLRERLERAR